MKLLSSYAVRRCIIADPGKTIISTDFDQIELRVAAALAGEQSLIDAARRGDSLHKTAAVRLFGKDYTPDQYRYTKNVNFGWLYGGGASTLSKQAGITFDAAKQIIRQYEDQFGALTFYKRREQEKVLRSALSTQEYKALQRLRSRMHAFREDTTEGRLRRAELRFHMDRLCYGRIGFVVTPFGRRLPVEATKAYTVVNYIVQSAARDIMAQALLDVMNDSKLEPTVLLIIHDEILGQEERRKAKATALRYEAVMSRTFLDVPITASGKVYGKSWGHGYK